MSEISTEERIRRSRLVIRECMRRRADGQIISDQSLIEANLDLMPELAQQLSGLRVIERAQQQFDSQNAGTSSGLRIRCPNCHNPVEIDDDQPLSRVECSSCGSVFGLVDDPTISRLDKIDQIGRFKLLDKLGSGAFGTVWSARDTELDRPVAVKIPRKGQLTHEDTELFLREARAAAQLSHPNIIRIHEVGRDGDYVYIVTDYVPGTDLADWLSDQLATPREAAEICVTMADALQHAHDRGVIHRDLKPSNVILDASGIPHLMDFGLAKREGMEVTLTMDGKLLGTPAYMSPEQARGAAHEADARTDIYSAGVILYELLTGERPFRGSTRMLIHQILVEDAPGPRRLNSSIPRDLETVCLKCLEKDPDRRYQTARDLQQDLRRFLGGEPVVARPISTVDRTWRWCRRNRLVAGLAASLLFAILGGFAGVTSQWIRATYEATRANNALQTAFSEAELRRRQIYLADIIAAQDAWETNDRAQCLRLLKRHLPQPGREDLRGFEWRYLWRQCLENQPKRTVPTSGTASIAISPDGKTLAVGDRGTLKLMDFTTGSERLSVDAHRDIIPALAFSPDGRMLASGSLDGHINLWRMDSAFPPQPQTLMERNDNSDRCVSAEFSPDGRQLTCGLGKDVVVWDLDRRSELRFFRGHTREVRSVAYSPSGETLASGSADGTVRIWNVESGQSITEIPTGQRQVYAIAYSPDGETVATGGWDFTIKLWDAATGTETKSPLLGHTDYVFSLTYSRDGKTLASGSWDRTVRLWDVEANGTSHQILKAHSASVTFVRFSPDGTLLASSDMVGKVYLFDYPLQTPRDTLDGRRVAFSKDGNQLVTWGSNRGRSPKLWDSVTGQSKSRADFDNPGYRFVTFSADLSKAAMAATDGTVFIQDSQNVEPRRLPERRLQPVTFLQLSPDGGTLALGSRRRLQLWDTATLRELALVDVYNNSEGQLRMSFSPCGQFFAATTEDEQRPLMSFPVTLWDRSGRLIRTFEGFNYPIRSLAFSDDAGTLAAGSWNAEIKTWDVRTGRSLFGPMTGHSNVVESLAFSPDGARLASGGADHTVRLWDVLTGEDIITFRDHQSRVLSVAFSPDGDMLASASEDGVVKLRRAAVDDEDYDPTVAGS